MEEGKIPNEYPKNGKGMPGRQKQEQNSKNSNDGRVLAKDQCLVYILV